MEVDSTLTLAEFLMWKVDALKVYLEKRGLRTSGNKQELAALCYAAHTMNIDMKVTQVEAIFTKILYLISICCRLILM